MTDYMCGGTTDFLGLKQEPAVEEETRERQAQKEKPRDFPINGLADAFEDSTSSVQLSRTPHQEVLLPERNVHSAFSATNNPGEESREQNKTKHPGWF